MPTEPSIRTARAVALAATALLAACGYAKVRSPEIAVPPVFLDTTASARAASIADIPWWRYFGDPALIALISEGLANNHSLAAATARVDEASALVTEARAQALPHVDLGFTTSPGVPRGSRFSSSFFGGVDVTWQIDFFGRYHAAASAARANFFAAQADRDAATQSLVAGIASTWLQLRSVDEQIAVAEANAASSDSSRRITELRTHQGVSSAVELRQAETQLYTVRDQIPGLRAAAAQLRDALAVLVGRNPGDGTVYTPTTDGVGVYPDPPVGLPSALLSRRPDVVAAEQRLRAAGYNVASARAALLPSIGLTAVDGRVSTALDGLVRSNRSAGLLSVGPNVGQPVFEGGALVAEVTRAKASQAEALAGYCGAVLTALQGANDSLAAYRQARLRRIEADRLEAAARETERLARERFTAGVTDFLEVLDAQRELYSAQLEKIAARQAQSQAGVDLYRNLGGGWAFPAPSRDTANSPMVR